MNFKLILTTALLVTLIGCNQEKTTSLAVALKVGDCLDQALSPYVLQVAAIEGETIFYYHMGEMGKKIYQRPRGELLKGKSPFLKSDCP
jgi:hypothetical protein